MTGINVRFDVEPEDFLADLTNAAYQVALKYGLNAPFIDVELDLQKAIFEVIRHDLHAIHSPLFAKEGKEALSFEQWS